MNHVIDDPKPTTRELPVHVDLTHDDEGHRHLQGWVACPERGPIDLEVCSECANCEGVLVKPGRGTVVVCSRTPPTPPTADSAVSWTSRPTLAVRRDMKARDLAEMMLEYRTDPFLVVDARGVAVGLVAQRDVLAAAIHGTLDTCLVGQIMRQLPSPMLEDTSMQTAAARLAEQRDLAVPLSDPAGRITMLLTADDAIAWAAEAHRR